MHLFLLFVIDCLILTVNSRYSLIDDYSADKFLDMFDFITYDEENHSYVDYVFRTTAVREGLFKVLSNNSIYIGVDTKRKIANNRIYGQRGRRSVRIHSKKTYNRGLFILDLAHMPGSVCGTWPAFWFLGNNPELTQNGKMIIIERANNENFNVISLHSSDNCSIKNKSSEFTGKFDSANCYIQAPDQGFDQGCSIKSFQAITSGDGFNLVGGGAYVVEWTDIFVKVWHFPRSKIPDDITKNQPPEPKNWGKPLALFSGNCNFNEKFYEEKIAFNIAFCGDWSGEMWAMDCGEKGSNCMDFVQNNPEAFNDTYWLINSLRVYSKETIQAKYGSYTLYISIFVPFTLVFIVVCLFIWWNCKRNHKRRHDSIYALARRAFKTISINIIDRTEEKDPWKIKRENLVVQREDKLGSGAFADVYIGKLVGDSAIKRIYNDLVCLSHFHDLEVAVKVLPQFAGEACQSDFQNEINFMKSLKYHPNLVCFLGYAVDPASPLLVLEYCVNGDLLNYLRKNKEKYARDQQLKQLVSFAWQVSSGLNYFTSLGFIHRDVAARNVLLDKDNVCKISDFGLCRTSDNEIYKSRGGKVPVKWLAIEALKSSEFSLKSDVWAFGVLLYEIFSLGKAPYAGIDNEQILPLLDSDKRLEKPVYSTNGIYELMLNCWQRNPESRPEFAQICQNLAQLLEITSSGYGYIDAVCPSISLVSETDDDSSTF